MPKQSLVLNDFSGGINSVKDPRDLSDNELVDIDNFMVDQQGAIRTAGRLKPHTDINNQTAKATGGYGLAVLESDYETEPISNTIVGNGGDYCGLWIGVGGRITYKAKISSTSWTGGKLIITTSQNHGFITGDPVIISSTTNYDGNYTVISGSGTTLTVSFATDYGSQTGYVAMDMANKYTAGSEIMISGTTSNNGYYVIHHMGTDTLYVIGDDIVNEYFVSGTISVYPRNEVLLVSADAVNGKVDTYSRNKKIWTPDQITIDSTSGNMSNYAKMIYYTVDGAIRACDAELGNASRVRWFGLIKRTHFEGTKAVKIYYDWYEKDNKLSPPTYGIIHPTNYPTANLGFNVTLTMSDDDNSAWEAATYEVAFSFIYDGNQESLLYIPTSNNTFTVANGQKVSAIVRAQTSSTGYNERISGGRIYARISGSDDAWFLLIDIDMRQGARATLNSKYTAWTSVGTSTTQTSTGSVDSLGQNIDTYENLNGYSHEVVSNSIGADGEGYKACVIGNRRAFVANMRRIESNTGENKSFPDRIYYSVANKFDTFPIDYYIDIAIGDSESYTALAVYADRLLAFKEYTLYIINISSGSPTDWYLESKHKFMGVRIPAQITETEMGIAWINESGCYFYSGSGNPVNLIGDRIAGLPCKIKTTIWSDFIQSTSMIGYIRTKKQLLIMRDCSGSLADSGNCYLFDFPTYSWVKLSNAFVNSKVYTNFIQDWNGDLAVGFYDGINTIMYYIWDDTSSSKKDMTFTTGDKYFNDLLHIKKVYKVYVTYKSSAIQTNALKYDINGGTTFSSTVENKNFPVASNWDVAVFTFSPPKECQSMALKLACPSIGTFDVNDIVIEYRLISKRVS